MEGVVETDGHALAETTHGDVPIKLITAVVQRGKADAPVQAALSAGAPGATIAFGRGQGVRERLGLLGLAIQPEKEVIFIVVEERLLDRVLTAMVRAGNLDQHGVGFVWVTPVERTIGFLPAEEHAEPSPEPRGRLPFLRRRGA
jgi:nitrogen regulatory protein P-II 1